MAHHVAERLELAANTPYGNGIIVVVKEGKVTLGGTVSDIENNVACGPIHSGL